MGKENKIIADPVENPLSSDSSDKLGAKDAGVVEYVLPVLSDNLSPAELKKVTEIQEEISDRINNAAKKEGRTAESYSSDEADGIATAYLTSRRSKYARMILNAVKGRSAIADVLGQMYNGPVSSGEKAPDPVLSVELDDIAQKSATVVETTSDELLLPSDKTARAIYAGRLEKLDEFIAKGNTNGLGLLLNHFNKIPYVPSLREKIEKLTNVLNGSASPEAIKILKKCESIIDQQKKAQEERNNQVEKMTASKSSEPENQDPVATPANKKNPVNPQVPKNQHDPVVSKKNQPLTADLETKEDEDSILEKAVEKSVKKFLIGLFLGKRDISEKKMLRQSAEAIIGEVIKKEQKLFDDIVAGATYDIKNNRLKLDNSGKIDFPKKDFEKIISILKSQRIMINRLENEALTKVKKELAIIEQENRKKIELTEEPLFQEILKKYAERKERIMRVIASGRSPYFIKPFSNIAESEKLEDMQIPEQAKLELSPERQKNLKEEMLKMRRELMEFKKELEAKGSEKKIEAEAETDEQSMKNAKKRISSLKRSIIKWIKNFVTNADSRYEDLDLDIRVSNNPQTNEVNCKKSIKKEVEKLAEEANALIRKAFDEKMDAIKKAHEESPSFEDFTLYETKVIEIYENSARNDINFIKGLDYQSYEFDPSDIQPYIDMKIRSYWKIFRKKMEEEGYLEKSKIPLMLKMIKENLGQ